MRADEVFGLVVPIDRISRHRSFLDVAFVILVSRYLLLAVSKELDTKERSRLFSVMSRGEWDCDFSLT